MLTKSGKQLEAVIKKAIEDHVITQAEYEEIIHLAHDDGNIDAHEKVLLKELKKMIVEKIVKRVP
ncbi:MAG: hypothetical protein MUD12_15695 [Spirochaetes bacterium]|jgi:hypothetical protein|nr:hypothetical protein [Spirochaetota bacterium]